MTLDEIKQRYERARANAVCAIDDLDQGADPARVYAEIEIAALWKFVWASEGQLTINQDVLDEMLGTTNS